MKLFRACDCYEVYCKHNPKEEPGGALPRRPRAFKITFRVNDTDFEWKPYWSLRGFYYVGWLWFIVNVEWWRK